MHRNEGPGGFECLVTHPALLRAVTDYALLAGPSQVIIGDAPLQLCNWRLLLHQGLQAVLDYYRAAGAPVHAADFRRTTLERRGHELIVQENLRPLDQYQLVELGDRSLLERCPMTAAASASPCTIRAACEKATSRAGTAI
jgi:hypothetical protein